MTQRSMIRSIPSHRPPANVESVAGVEAHADATGGSLTSIAVNAVEELVRRRRWDRQLAAVLVADQIARGLVYPSTTPVQLADAIEEWCCPVGWGALVSPKYLACELDGRRGPMKGHDVSRRMPT